MCKQVLSSPFQTGTLQRRTMCDDDARFAAEPMHMFGAFLADQIQAVALTNQITFRRGS